MKADFTLSNLYWNMGLRNFFFRSQADDTLTACIELAANYGKTKPEMLDYLAGCFDDMDIDEVEETFYSYGAESILEDFAGLEREN